jgi:hypothetical protein
LFLHLKNFLFISHNLFFCLFKLPPQLGQLWTRLHTIAKKTLFF